MELAKVFCPTKNEYQLIEDYILFYGGLFGLRNVVIVDNDSTHPQVLEVYQKYQPLGVTVRVEKRPYSQLEKYMTEIMRGYVGTCRFLLWLDTDEFLFLPHAELSPKNVRESLESLPHHGSIFHYHPVLASTLSSYDPPPVHPARELTQFYDQSWGKVFARATDFDRVGLSNHQWVAKRGDTIVSKIGILHFHHTGEARNVEKAMDHITGFGYPLGTGPLEAQMAMAERLIQQDVHGHHKVKIYWMFILRKWILAKIREYHHCFPNRKEWQDLLAGGMVLTELENRIKNSTFTPSGETEDQLLYWTKYPTPEMIRKDVQQFLKMVPMVEWSSGWDLSKIVDTSW